MLTFQLYREISGCEYCEVEAESMEQAIELANSRNTRLLNRDTTMNIPSDWEADDDLP